MIILEEEDQLPKLRRSSFPTLRFPERVAGRNRNPLPDYETSQAEHHVIDKPNIQRRVDARFWRATLYAMLIYIVLSVGITVAVVKSIRSLRYRPPPTQYYWDDDGTNSTGGSHDAVVFAFPLMDAEAYCSLWQIADSNPSDGFYSTSFDVGFPGNTAFTFRSNVSDQANGPQHVYGNLTVDVNADENATEAHVYVKLRTSSLDLRSKTYVCLQGDEGSAELSIYVPGVLGPSDLIRFEISLLYPQTSSPLTVDKLLTYLPLFGQKIGHLDQRIQFQKIIIEGPTSTIVVGSLQAPKILVRNSYGEITGSFNSSDTLVLDTIGAPINADITLFHDAKRKSPTFLSLDTGNSALNAKVTLLAPNVYSILPTNLPSYTAQVRTFSGPLNLDIAHSPTTPPAALVLRAQNNLAQSNVTLDSKYQGTFHVQTKLASATVDQGSTKVAPNGQVINYIYDHTASDRMSGWVGWGTRPGRWYTVGQGHAEIISSLHPVYLRLSRT